MTKPKLEQLAYDLTEASAATSLSITTLRKEIHSGALKAKKYGRGYLLRAKDIEAFLENLPDAD